MLIVGLAHSNDPNDPTANIMAEAVRQRLEAATGQEVFIVFGCTALIHTSHAEEPIDVTPVLEEAEQEDG